MSRWDCISWSLWLLFGLNWFRMWTKLTLFVIFTFFYASFIVAAWLVVSVNMVNTYICDSWHDPHISLQPPTVAALSLSLSSVICCVRCPVTVRVCVCLISERHDRDSIAIDWCIRYAGGTDSHVHIKWHIFIGKHSLSLSFFPIVHVCAAACNR